jgi:ABC-2 type transport system ATP-binding protein
VIQFRNTALKYWRGAKALKGVSFVLERNSFCGVFGRNGAGKTTLLSLIAGYRAPDVGTVSVLGEDPYDNPDVMPKITFAFNRPERENAVTCKEMMECCKAFRPGWDEARAKGLLEKLDVPVKTDFSSMSMGQKVAARVALALASNPEVAIYDEICSGLNPDLRKLLFSEILDDYKKRPKTVLMSTRYISETEALFTKALILDEGKLATIGDCGTLLESAYIVSGDAKALEKFTNGRKTAKIASSEPKAAILDGLEDSEIEQAKKSGLEISHPSLEDYVGYMTEKGGLQDGD